MSTAETSGEDPIGEAERLVFQTLKSRKEGLNTKEITDLTSTLSNDDRTTVVNRILQTGDAEMLSVEGTNGWILRYRKTNLPSNASAEEHAVYAIIETADKSGIWIRDIREQSGLSEAQIRRVLKSLEQRKLVKSIKPVGSTKKSYILYDIEADENLTGGTFFTDQELDSQFVETLIQVCVNMLQAKQNEAAEKFPNDKRAQIEFSCTKAEDVAKFIHERGVSKIPLALVDVQNILNIAVIDGKLERRNNNSYRVLNRPVFISPLVTVPCYFCPMRSECSPGHRISPETCEYMKTAFDL